MAAQSGPLRVIRYLFSKIKKTGPPEAEETLAPLQILRELDEFFRKGGVGEEKDPEKLRKRFAVARAISMLMKPLLRFEGLLSMQAKMGLELITSQSMTPEVMAAMAPGVTTFKQYVEGALDCADNKERPLVWMEWCLSTDLFLAFDVQPFVTEALVLLPMPLGPEPNESLIDVAEQAGVPVEYCSAGKNALGALLAGQLPEPACIVTVSHPCDSMSSSYQSIEYLTDYPTFRLDTPYWEDERALDYYTDEMRRLIGFLEEHLERKLDYDRLREVLTEVNRTHELFMEMNEMYKVSPCPGSGMPLIISWLFREFAMGSPKLTEMAGRLHRLTRERLDAGKGTIKNEKIRVIWYDVPIAFYPLILWMEETFGAVVVVDAVSFINQPAIDTSTPESMIRGMAAETMNLAMARQFHGPLEFFHRDLHRVCEEYEGDCFIYAGHVGCKHGWASTRQLKEYMRKIEMPLLILTSDIFDQRVTNLDKLKNQIEEFFVNNGMV